MILIIGLIILILIILSLIFISKGLVKELESYKLNKKVSSKNLVKFVKLSKKFLSIKVNTPLGKLNLGLTIGIILIYFGIVMIFTSMFLDLFTNLLSGIDPSFTGISAFAKVIISVIIAIFAPISLMMERSL